MKLLLSKLKLISDRSAQFKTVIALNINGKTLIFEGICKGEISHEKKGKGGFGYDPIFIPNNHKKTFAELSLSRKNEIGHRGKAVTKLVNYLNLPWQPNLKNLKGNLRNYSHLQLVGM